jgi:hypothetical protein
VPSPDVFKDPFRRKVAHNYKYALPNLPEVSGRTWLVTLPRHCPWPPVPPQFEGIAFHTESPALPFLWRGITVFDYRVTPTLGSNGLPSYIRSCSDADFQTYFLMLQVPESAVTLLEALEYRRPEKSDMYQPDVLLKSAPNPALQRTPFGRR